MRRTGKQSFPIAIKGTPPSEYSIDESLGAALKGAALAALAHAQNAQWEVKSHELNLVQQEFNRQMGAWSDQMSIIIGKSAEEWAKAEGRINSGYFAWREAFRETYAVRDAA
jgi:hypothetical protein